MLVAKLELIKAGTSCSQLKQIKELIKERSFRTLGNICIKVLARWKKRSLRKTKSSCRHNQCVAAHIYLEETFKITFSSYIRAFRGGGGFSKLRF